MKNKSTLPVFAAMGIACGCIFSVAASPQSVPPRPAAPAPKTAEQVYKNIQALKGTPADQLIPAMQVFTASLGVTCDYCHGEDRSKDDKKAKETARKMIRMMAVINKDNFDARREVTCYTCHHDAEIPPAIPSLTALYSDTPPLPEDSDEIGDPKPGAVPSVDQLLQKYAQAVGGAESLAKLTSLVEKGTVEFDGQKAPIEIFTKEPGERASVVHLPEGNSVSAFDGHSGWNAVPDAPVRPMGRAALDAARMDADLQFPLHVAKLFPKLRVGFRTTVADHTAYVVMGETEGKPPVKLYFDSSSGLLLRLVRYADSPVGRAPTQIDFADYRDVAGAKLSFHMVVAQLSNRLIIQLEQAQPNAPIDEATFAKPPENPVQSHK